MIGHRSLVGTFKKLAEENELGHGYIFYGPSMVGKRTFAVSLANFLEVKSFSEQEEGAILQDTLVVCPAGDSIGIDAIREIKNFLWQKPTVSLRRTLIIDDAEFLTTEAQNALLKIAEEPPVSSLLIMVTSDIESIMPTILSRLPKIYFGSVGQSEIEGWLTEKLEITKAKAGPLAKKSLGKPGLATRLVSDTIFQKNVELAEKYLKSTKTTRKDLIKKIIDPDEFSLRKFLEAVIINLAWDKPTKTKAELWHRTLELYGTASNFGLNPRLQLEALLT